MKKLKLGDKLLCVYKYRREYTEFDCTVKKVGRLYFSIESMNNIPNDLRFKISDWKQDANIADYTLYQNRDVLLDENEKDRLVKEIRTMIKEYGTLDITLDQAQQIYDILKKG